MAARDDCGSLCPPGVNASGCNSLPGDCERVPACRIERTCRRIEMVAIDKLTVCSPMTLGAAPFEPRMSADFLHHRESWGGVVRPRLGPDEDPGGHVAAVPLTTAPDR